MNRDGRTYVASRFRTFRKPINRPFIRINRIKLPLPTDAAMRELFVACRAVTGSLTNLVGEKGPEIVRLPKGSKVIRPTDLPGFS